MQLAMPEQPEPAQVESAYVPWEMTPSGCLASLESPSERVRVYPKGLTGSHVRLSVIVSTPGKSTIPRSLRIAVNGKAIAIGPSTHRDQLFVLIRRVGTRAAILERWKVHTSPPSEDALSQAIVGEMSIGSERSIVVTVANQTLVDVELSGDVSIAGVAVGSPPVEKLAVFEKKQSAVLAIDPVTGRHHILFEDDALRHEVWMEREHDVELGTVLAFFPTTHEGRTSCLIYRHPNDAQIVVRYHRQGMRDFGLREVIIAEKLLDHPLAKRGTIWLDVEGN